MSGKREDNRASTHSGSMEQSASSSSKHCGSNAGIGQHTEQEQILDAVCKENLEAGRDKYEGSCEALGLEVDVL